MPVMALAPTPGDNTIELWWFVPAETVAAVLQILGYATTITEHNQLFRTANRLVPNYTVVGERN